MTINDHAIEPVTADSLRLAASSLHLANRERVRRLLYGAAAVIERLSAQVMCRDVRNADLTHDLEMMTGAYRDFWERSVGGDALHREMAGAWAAHEGEDER